MGQPKPKIEGAKPKAVPKSSLSKLKDFIKTADDAPREQEPSNKDLKPQKPKKLQLSMFLTTVNQPKAEAAREEAIPSKTDSGEKGDTYGRAVKFNQISMGKKGREEGRSLTPRLGQSNLSSRSQMLGQKQPPQPNGALLIRQKHPDEVDPTFKPKINKKSEKLAQSKAPIFSKERY